MENLLIGLDAVFQGNHFLWLLVGTVGGFWLGAIPGLGPVMALAVVLPFTFELEPLSALLLLASVHASGNFGGSFSSILLNVPGDAVSAATTFDGYPMARQGKARVALGIATAASFFGGLAGVIVLVTLAEPILRVALKFGPAEYFALAMLGLSVVSLVSTGSTFKGLAMGCLGLGVGFIGIDAVIGVPRYTFGSLYLQAGVGLIPVVIGLFAVAELIAMIMRGGTIAQAGRLEGNLWQGLAMIFRYPRTLLQSTGIGITIGAIPGIGSVAAIFLAYMAAQKTSRHSKLFGKGAPEGVIAPEAANNACTAATLIPTLTLGIPGGSGAAILLVAITIHGIAPGAYLFDSRPELVWGFFSGLMMLPFLFAICGILMIRWFALITLVRVEFLAPIVLVLSMMGAYAFQRSITDLLVTVLFGVFGYLARRHGYPLIPLVIGLILGPLAEASFAQALMISVRDYSTFITRPISGVTLLICVILIFGPEIYKRFQQIRT